jgi:hypothetical protein
MSNAEATIKSSIIAGLSEHAHLSGIRADVVGRLPTEQLVADLINALFDGRVRWALRAYADELDN